MERVINIENIKDGEGCGNPLYCLIRERKLKIMDDSYKTNYYNVLL